MEYLVLIIFLVLILIYVKLWFDDIRDRKLLETVTSLRRGTKSERDLVLKLLKGGIPANAIFHDLYVRKHDGNFTQIDLIVPTRVGLLVFEVKDYSGWIFGSGNGFQWTQVLAYGDAKFKMYNPVEQNRRHIVELKKCLKQFETIPFYSIIVFFGDCELKKIENIPQNTYVVKSYEVVSLVIFLIANKSSAEYTDKIQIVKLLKDSVANGAIDENRLRHASYVDSVLGR